MAEKTNLENSLAKLERFEFVLTVNGNIVCQRYFRISGFKERSLGSVQLTDAVEECVKLINEDLKEKSNIYNWYTAPQVFQNKEELDAWVEKYNRGESKIKLEVPTVIVLRDSDETFVWCGDHVRPHRSFNKSEYVGDNTDGPCILKFSFLCDKKEVRSISWDISRLYPRFVRSNIDLSNSKNRYDVEGLYAPLEKFIIDRFNASRKDIISTLVYTICNACSKENVNEYDSVVNYGGKEYNLNIAGAKSKYMKDVYAYYSKKTKDYFSTL